jgi:ATP-dependent Clp protease ATP-binding subunit ClpX
MFELPNLRGVEEVVVNGEVVEGKAAPLHVHAKTAKPSEAS